MKIFLFQVLYDLHYPPVNKTMLNNMLDICEVRENILVTKNISLKILQDEMINNGRVKHCRPSPFNTPAKKTNRKVGPESYKVKAHSFIP